MFTHTHIHSARRQPPLQRRRHPCRFSRQLTRRGSLSRRELGRRQESERTGGRGRVVAPAVFVKQIKRVGDSSPALRTAAAYGPPVQNKEICIH
ncbi:hypothetical protein QQF64_017200 [Cirrhinus molitorella]|uniref:Uncharacterized protein n=1 Tax=Cirrhinus molitorella TaxID=172907 RepID=A0ABR3LLM1_9TELE